MSKKPYQIIEEEIPKAKKLGRKGSRYDPILDEFLKSGIDNARITYTGVSDSNLAVGLRNRVDSKKLPITVIVRTGKGVYLKKKT